MNKQRKVLITITYNEMGIIIDTKAEEVAQPNLQPICNQLATDTISRQAAIDALCRECSGNCIPCDSFPCGEVEAIQKLPSADAVEVVRCKDCKWFNDIGCSIRIVDDSDKPTENDYCSFGEQKDG